MFINTHVTNNGLLPVSENGEPFNFRGFNSATSTTFGVSCPAYDTTIYPAQNAKPFPSPYDYGYSNDEVNIASSLLAINGNNSNGSTDNSARSSSVATSPPGLTRSAEEEDKRRRNTLASARFRQKKKQRDEILEKEVKALKEEKAELAARLAQVEFEYKMLRQLVTGKESNNKVVTENLAHGEEESRSGVAPHLQQAIRPKPHQNVKTAAVLRLNVLPPNHH